MKKSPLLASCAALLAVLLAGCGHLDLAAPGDPNRVLVGTVTFSSVSTLPDDAEVLVRIMDPHPQPVSATGGGQTPPGQMPLLNQPVTATMGAGAALGPQELGEQTIKHPVVQRDPGDGHAFIPYRIEYQADDETLRRGLSIEVRISYDGRVRLINSNQYSVMLSDVKDPHTVEADAMR
jgi:uncharacterized lipoprotein YbaY